jgi:hypothetical protein
VIRRGFWLATGAVLGVAGYRRATRLVDGLTRGGAGNATQSARGRQEAAGRMVSGRPVSTAARVEATAGFVRDVRDGVAEYLELHHRELARNLGGRSNRTSSG